VPVLGNASKNHTSVRVKTQSARSSETLVTYHITTRCHNTENDLNFHRRENLKSR